MDTEEEAVDAVNQLARLDRRKVRERFEESHVVSAYAARGRGNEKSGEACDRQVNDRLPGVHCFEKGAGPLFIAISLAALRRGFTVLAVPSS